MEEHVGTWETADSGKQNDERWTVSTEAMGSELWYLHLGKDKTMDNFMSLS